MSLPIQNNYSMDTNQTGVPKQTSSITRSFIGVVASKKTEQTTALTPAQDMETFKKEFYEDLGKISTHNSVSNSAVTISEEAFQKMKEDPTYREKILSLIKRDCGSSYGTGNTSVLITVGATIDDYRADSWSTDDSKFDSFSEKSFYKKKRKARREKQKIMMEEYLEKRAEQKQRNLESLARKDRLEQENQTALQKTDANKAYASQFLFKS